MSRTLTALTAAKLAFFPLLLAQGLYARRRALELPEAAGPREGQALTSAGRRRQSEALRLLVVGDSSAAGVGVAEQRDALAATVARHLAEELGRPVHWRLVARTGNTVLETLQQLRESAPLGPADILLSAVGVNDVVRQVPTERSLSQLLALHDELRAQTGLRYWLHSGLPPMHQFPLLPRPLRWLLGSQAELLNRALQAELGDRPDRALRRLPEALRHDLVGQGLIAEDGFHPGPRGYALWGEALGEFLARRWVRLEKLPRGSEKIGAWDDLQEPSALAGKGADAEPQCMQPIAGRLTQTLQQAQDLQTMARPLLEMLQSVTGMESSYLTRVDEQQGEQQVLFANNSGSLQIPAGLSVPWGDTLCKRALDEGRSFTSDVPAQWGDSAAARELGIQSYVSAAVRSADGQLYGTLCAASRERQNLGDDAQHVLGLFSTLIGQHLDREHLVAQLARANAELAAIALTDSLTGLPNRRHLHEDMPRIWAWCRRERREVALAFIDLDGFKQVNDRLGHQVGDQLLIEVGQRLKGTLRGHDMLARLGGDEFVVVGPGAPLGSGGGTASAALRARLEQALGGAYQLNGERIVFGGASVGVLGLDPAQVTPEQALAQADAAMYAAKAQRRAQALSAA